MPKLKFIQVNLKVATRVVAMLERAEAKLCVGCAGDQHEDSCPAEEAKQLGDYIRMRVNNPNKKYDI
jgi:hypothetical protein